MLNDNVDSLVSVISVKDLSKCQRWYEKLFSRLADQVPYEGVLEWQLTSTSWIQVTLDPERAGYGTVVIGVKDIQIQKDAWEEQGLTTGEIQIVPDLIKMLEMLDPEGNKIVLVQEL